jgi:Flp pilus assembly protein TadG
MRPRRPLPASALLSRAVRLLRRLRADRRGATLVIVGFAIIPLTIAVGMAIDYGRAARMQTKLNAIADSAALAAVTTPMMSQSSAAACLAARLMFVNQVTGLDSLRINTLDPAQLSIQVTDNASATSCSATAGSISTSYQRSSTVTWKGTADNIFGGLLGMMKTPIGGTATAQAATAPNIDFYVLLDTSGSMALPSTSAGLTLLRSKTGGCAFACHSTNDEVATRKDGSTGDYYSVATSFGIPLRVDEARTAVANMMKLAGDVQVSNKATYRAALATFAAADSRANNSFLLRQPLTTSLSSVAAQAAAATTSLYYKNNCPTSSFCNSDADTASSNAFSRMDGVIANPGNGTKNPSDRPQAIMIVITDGMRDESRPGSRPEVAFETGWCSYLKSRNIGIAILYTEYLPGAIDNDSWSVKADQGNVLNRLPLIEPALKSCVSRPEYFTKVTTDDDISAALATLFRTLVKTAYITR